MIYLCFYYFSLFLFELCNLVNHFHDYILHCLQEFYLIFLNLYPFFIFLDALQAIVDSTVFLTLVAYFIELVDLIFDVILDLYNLLVIDPIDPIEAPYLL